MPINKDTDYLLLYPPNTNFISGKIREPVNIQEMHENIAIRLGVPYPYSSIKIIVFSLIFVIASLIASFVGVFVVNAFISNLQLSIASVVLLPIGFGFIILPFYVVPKLVKIMRYPPDIVEYIYMKSILKHYLVKGKVDWVDYSSPSLVVHYSLESKKRDYTYKINNKNIYNIPNGSKIFLLFIDKDIHCIL